MGFCDELLAEGVIKVKDDDSSRAAVGLATVYVLNNLDRFPELAKIDGILDSLSTVLSKHKFWNKFTHNKQ